jgi:cobalt-zinc-cadmium efflux system outer membrane protein
MKRRSHALVVLLCLFFSFSWLAEGQAQAQNRDQNFILRLNESLDYLALEKLVRTYSPALRSPARDAALAEYAVAQTRLYDNPTLDGAWATVPVGKTNPEDLSRPFANVPNYAVGLSYTFPVKKRAPRIERAQAVAAGTRASLDAVCRDNALDLADILGELATATLRREGIGDLVNGSKRAVELAEARLAAKFGTPLEVDRLTVDLQRTEQLLLSIEADIRGSLAECSRLVGTRCENFSDGKSARAYLARWLAPSSSSEAQLEHRPDLRALSAYIDASRADARLAEAEAIPDPTVRLGYLHDRFIISGNQRNSLNVGVSIPLPVFNHGQVHKRAADFARQSLHDEHEGRISSARARIPVLRERFQLQRERCERLTVEILPKGEAVLRDLDKAAENRLIPVTDVIQARRSVGELLIEKAESCGDAYAAVVELIREIPANEQGHD